MHQIILFRPEARLIDFLSMQLSLEDLSIFINTGSYEFMSLIRIAFVFKPGRASVETQSGGYRKRLPKYDIDTTITEYLEVFESPVERLTFKEKVKNKRKKSRKKKKEKKEKKHLTKHKRR